MTAEFLIVQAGDYIGAVKDGKHRTISYAPRGEFLSFVKSLKEDYPQCKFRCVIDKKLSDVVIAQALSDKRRLDNLSR